jgi:hypothetical protein
MAARSKTEGSDKAGTGALAASVVRVTARQPSRWRAGRNFGPVPVDIPAAELSEDDLARLRADPLLVVVADSDAQTAEVAHPQK